MADSYIEIPTGEEEPLIEKQVRAPRKGLSIGLLCGVGALGLMTTPSMKALPTNVDELRSTLPVLAFVVLILLRSVREIYQAGWEMDGALKLFAFALPYCAIATGSSNVGADLQQLGAAVGVVAVILDQLRWGDTTTWRRMFNIVAMFCIIIGSILQNGDLKNVWGQLPFYAWAVTAVAWSVLITFNPAHPRFSDKNDGFNDSLWFLALYTAVIFAPEGSADWQKIALRAGCILGMAYSALYLLGVGTSTILRAVSAVGYVLLWFPLCWGVVSNTTLSEFEHNIAFYALAITLAVRGVFCVLAINEDKSAADRTDQYCWLFVLYLALNNATRLHVNGDNSFAKAAGQMAQIGPIIGLISLALQFVGTGTCQEWVDRLRHAAEVITCLGVLLA
eukprot:Hpha_TRINITY_DN15867_c0_g8::TRINITY_DN15867_c0_g8_i1::g.188826::m.188826